MCKAYKRMGVGRLWRLQRTRLARWRPLRRRAPFFGDLAIAEIQRVAELGFKGLSLPLQAGVRPA